LGAVKELASRELGFRKRLKRWSLSPGKSPDLFNIALNIEYSILAREVWRAVFIANLNNLERRKIRKTSVSIKNELKGETSKMGYKSLGLLVVAGVIRRPH